MTAERLALEMGIGKAEKERIEAAVRKAEAATSGEITLALIPSSSAYTGYELLASVLFGVFVFCALLPFQGAVSALLERLFWVARPWYLPAFYGMASFAAIALAFLASNTVALDRIIVPRSAKTLMVYKRGVQHFVESGVYSTKDQNGILVFISYMEREVRVFADKGFTGKVSQEEWEEVTSSIVRGIRNKDLTSALELAIGRCGALMAAHFPAQNANPNELSDRLWILEEGL